MLEKYKYNFLNIGLLFDQAAKLNCILSYMFRLRMLHLML